MAADIDLVDFSRTGFRATEETDKIADRLREQLGYGANYVPARLAIGRSLAVADRPPRATGEPGRSIRSETLFGGRDDLATWVSLLVEHAGEMPADTRMLQGWVADHWARGMQLLDGAWEAAGQSPSRFYLSLAEAAGLPTEAAQAGSTAGKQAAPTAIRIGIGPVSTDAATADPVLWHVNAGGSSPHAAMMGGVGSGKTRTAVQMLRAMRAITPFALVAFDFKGDMVDERNALDQAFGAKVIQPPGEPVPLDVLAVADRTPRGLGTAAMRLRDSLATLKRSDFGARQRDALAEAAEVALRTHQPCTLADVRDALKRSYAQKGMKEDGATSTLGDLCRLPLFTPAQSPAEFFAHSWIIRLPQDMPNEARNAVVTLVTDALDRWLNPQADAPADAEGNRALRIACVIDEAHRVLGAKLPGLGNLIRLGRSKGGMVMLISQQPGDFEGEDDDFLAEMGLVAALNTNAKPAAVKRILGTGADLANLARGEAWVKLRGDPPRRIIAWR